MWGSYFMSMPFLALHLTQNLNASEMLAGLVVGISPLTSILCTFVVGFIADKWGRFYLIPLSIFGCALVFFGFAGATLIWHFLVINAIFGIFNTGLRINLTALLSDLSDLHNKKAILQMQYYVVNLSACFGPLAGAYFYLKGYQLAFIITGVLFLCLGVPFLLLLKSELIQSAQAKATHLKVKDLYCALVSDRALIYFLITFVMSACVFSQFDTTFPQYLHQLFDQKGVTYFAQIMAVNALTIIVCQFLLLEWTKHLAVTTVMAIGVLPQILGFFLFVFLPQNLLCFSIAMVVFSIGEILLISNTNVLIDDMSPPALKSSYFGALELHKVGQMLGPIVGGWILNQFGGKAIFWFCIAILCIALWTFQKGVLHLQAQNAHLADTRS